MSEHYSSEQHQNAIIAFIRRDLAKFTTYQPEGGSGMDIDTFPHTTTMSSDNTNAQVQEVCETIDVLSGGIQALSEDSQRLNNEALQLQNGLDVLAKEVATLKLSIQEQNTYLDGLKPSQEILHQDVSSLKQKVEDLQFISYDGSLTWKISSFAEKMADAQSERQTSIYSPPFYSSPTGYKMRARLYLHGDGNARRTHMSLFFVLMRSEYDAILKFPFNYKVTFCLYDQTPTQRHIIDSFRPDIKSNSFQRPRSEMNIASGIPKFFPLAMIQQEGNPYVRDDTIFIKIMVDFGDMAKTLLSYALSLNPGLPTNVQQAMIKQEAERRAQQTSSSTAT
jgi:FtsZ-binding cell division protein ZapB